LRKIAATALFPLTIAHVAHESGIGLNATLGSQSVAVVAAPDKLLQAQSAFQRRARSDFDQPAPAAFRDVHTTMAVAAGTHTDWKLNVEAAPQKPVMSEPSSRIRSRRDDDSSDSSEEDDDDDEAEYLP